MSTETTTESIPLELPNETWNCMVEMYMRHAFRPESIEVYWESIGNGATPERATYDAIRNDATIHLLEKMLADGANLPVEPSTPAE